MGETGKIMIRGPQVMSGYHNNPAATAQVIDGDGFFDTGDLGRFNPPTGDLIVTGRAKDTIVLNNGENVEPQPLEVRGEMKMKRITGLTREGGLCIYIYYIYGIQYT